MYIIPKSFKKKPKKKKKTDDLQNFWIIIIVPYLMVEQPNFAQLYTANLIRMTTVSLNMFHCTYMKKNGGGVFKPS